MALFERGPREKDEAMARPEETTATPRDSVISIIGPGMRVIGDCETDGTLRVEGRVEGMVRAGKAVVVGKDGSVHGDLITQDAIVGGRVDGTIVAESRLELQATCVVEGEIRARRLKLDEGGQISGTVQVGDIKTTSPATASSSSSASSKSGTQTSSPQPAAAAAAKS
jgi:cytoskeletal protein CcmA (bactofilin family)